MKNKKVFHISGYNNGGTLVTRTIEAETREQAKKEFPKKLVRESGGNRDFLFSGYYKR